MLLEAATRWPVTTWLLITSAVALWAYAVFQAFWYGAGQLEADIDALTRQLPALPVGEPAAGDAAVTPEPVQLPAPAAVVAPRIEPAATTAAVAWPLPRPRRSVTVAVEHADAERAQSARFGTGPLALLLLLGLLAGRASAGTYYVDGASPQCSNSGPGTQ